MTNENLPSCRAKKGLSGSPHEPRNTAWHAISIHKLGLYPLDWLWRPPRAAELLGAACGGLLALISLREIKPSSPGLDPSNASDPALRTANLTPPPGVPGPLIPLWIGPGLAPEQLIPDAPPTPRRGPPVHSPRPGPWLRCWFSVNPRASPKPINDSS